MFSANGTQKLTKVCNRELFLLIARCANGSHQKSGTHENRVLRVNGTHLFVLHLHLARFFHRKMRKATQDLR